MSEDAPHYARGSIVLVQFEPLKAGSKKRKVRPCVIVTNGIKIRRSRHAELLYGIVPLTTRSSAAAEVLAPRFVAREGGLPADAVALCIHFRTVEATRVAGYVGELNASEIDDLEESLIKLFHIKKIGKLQRAGPQVGYVACSGRKTAKSLQAP